MSKIKNDTRRVFFKKGTCSRTLHFILDRHFDNLKANEEFASSPLAGGILSQGYQCGMLWGSTLAASAESFRKYSEQNQAIVHAMMASQYIIESFIKRAKSTDCMDITGTNFGNKYSMLKYMLTGKPIKCFNLAAKWAPEAIQAATEGLFHNPSDLPEIPVSCASEVARKLGASDEELVTVAGLAGGIGLSGNACGALGAAIWLNTLARVRNQTYKYGISDPDTEKIIAAFQKATNYEMECRKITGRQFKSIADHTEFIKGGGCGKVIEILAGAK